MQEHLKLFLFFLNSDVWWLASLSSVISHVLSKDTDKMLSCVACRFFYLCVFAITCSTICTWLMLYNGVYSFTNLYSTIFFVQLYQTFSRSWQMSYSLVHHFPSFLYNFYLCNENINTAFEIRIVLLLVCLCIHW